MLFQLLSHLVLQRTSKLTSKLPLFVSDPGVTLSHLPSLAVPTVVSKSTTNTVLILILLATCTPDLCQYHLSCVVCVTVQHYQEMWSGFYWFCVLHICNEGSHPKAIKMHLACCVFRDALLYFWVLCIPTLNICTYIHTLHMSLNLPFCDVTW